jgi:hypothetical protein
MIVVWGLTAYRPGGGRERELGSSETFFGKYQKFQNAHSILSMFDNKSVHFVKVFLLKTIHLDMATPVCTLS